MIFQTRNYVSLPIVFITLVFDHPVCDFNCVRVYFYECIFDPPIYYNTCDTIISLFFFFFLTKEKYHPSAVTVAAVYFQLAGTPKSPGVDIRRHLIPI